MQEFQSSDLSISLQKIVELAEEASTSVLDWAAFPPRSRPSALNQRLLLQERSSSAPSSSFSAFGPFAASRAEDARRSSGSLSGNLPFFLPRERARLSDKAASILRFEDSAVASDAAPRPRRPLRSFTSPILIALGAIRFCRILLAVPAGAKAVRGIERRLKGVNTNVKR